MGRLLLNPELVQHLNPEEVEMALRVLQEAADNARPDQTVVELVVPPELDLIPPEEWQALSEMLAWLNYQKRHSLIH